MTMLQKLNAKIGGVYYGWWNAVASMVCLMLIFGVPTVLLPFVYGPVIDEFGWTGPKSRPFLRSNSPLPL